MLSEILKIVDTRKRVGRGGKRGGTSGRGHKGQKARTSGTVGPVFEGGQMPLVRRLPKRGFSNARFAKNFEIVSVEDLERKFNAGEEVTREALVARGLIHGKRGWGVKVLGGGELSKALTVVVDALSKSAHQAIVASKGKVQLLAKEIAS